MAKINEVTKVVKLNVGDFIPIILADGNIGQIRKADFANALADVMRIGSVGKNGLLSMNNFSSFGNFGIPVANATDLNEVHKIAPQGLSTFSTKTDTLNRPGAYGVMLNLQRLRYGDIGSHFVAQLYYSSTGEIIYRYSISDESGKGDMTFSSWETQGTGSAYITKRLTQIGWYRLFVGNLNNQASSATVNISNDFGTVRPGNVCFHFSGSGYHERVVKLLNKVDNVIPKIRMLYQASTSLPLYVDIYYSVEKTNTLRIAVSNSICNNRPTLDLVEEAIPEGYSAQEFTL